MIPLKFSNLTILYGSETGNCQDLAKIIAWKVTQRARNASLQNFVVKTLACDEYDIRRLPQESLILFVCSTTGVGEEPQNMKKFWRFLLRRDLPRDALTSLNCAVIGLGDSSYLKYNFVAKKLFKRLGNLGANPLAELALGDDQHELGPYVKIDPWLTEFYNFVIPDEIVSASEGSIENSVVVTEVQPEAEEPSDLENIQDKSGPFDCLHPYQATISENVRVTSEDHFQDTRLVSLELDPTFHYKLGDVVLIYPENRDVDVESFLEFFSDNPDYSPDRWVHLAEDPSASSLPLSTCYYRHAFTRRSIQVRELIKEYLELTAIPKRSFFELLFRFSRDDLEREKLKQFAEGVDLEDLYEYVNRPKRNILEVLADFPHTTPHIPFRYLFDLIPAIQARPYSIASSPDAHPNHIQILVAVVEYQTRIRQPRLGLCSNWLARLEAGSTVRIFLRRSNFVAPSDSTRPLVLVAAGTGVAPFRAFIEHRTGVSSTSDASTILFFGCRYRTKDFYFREQFESYPAEQLKIYGAFSRENPNESKDYVQNRLTEQAALIHRTLIEDGGFIWIAGRSQQYPTLVRDALLDALRSGGIESPESILSSLELKKRVVFECW